MWKTDMGKSDENEVWDFVQEMNRVWAIDKKPERLSDYFAPEMVAITPTDRHRREGRGSCVAGWTEFVQATKILRWAERNPVVLMLAEGRSAVVAYDFEINHELGGREVQMRGRDLMTLDKRDGRWWLVADHFSPTPG
jgi:ketosteroid isomerase-like protein